MADIGEDELRKEINAILKDADLSVTSAKKVRQQLEDKLKCNLSSRKQEIDDMVMSFVNSKEDEDDEDEEDDDDEEEENNKRKPAKRPAPAKKSKAKKSKAESSEDGEGSESEGSEEDDDDYEAKKPAPKKKAAAKKKKGSESDSDSDWGKGGKKKAGGGGGGGGGRGKGGGYTKAKRLSPALASLMGKDSMPRHEVVKKMWAMIKERNLYDPNNKQFAICDDDLYKVIGVKRFRTFGMMKYLKSHFHD